MLVFCLGIKITCKERQADIPARSWNVFLDTCLAKCCKEHAGLALSTPDSHGAVVAPAVLLDDLVVAHLPAALCLRHLHRPILCWSCGTQHQQHVGSCTNPWQPSAGRLRPGCDVGVQAPDEVCRQLMRCYIPLFLSALPPTYADIVEARSCSPGKHSFAAQACLLDVQMHPGDRAAVPMGTLSLSHRPPMHPVQSACAPGGSSRSQRSGPARAPHCRAH